jgi:hypothetical protein
MRTFIRAFVMSVALGGALPLAALLASEQVAAAADEGEGVPVKVIVTDGEGKPIPTAVIRHPQEADRHRVNTFDGSWEASVLYLPDGTELKFLKGMTLELEISAPGYVNQRIQYLVRSRKNVLPITLEKMAFELGTDPEEEDPVIQFGRDKPIDGAGSNPNP